MQAAPNNFESVSARELHELADRLLRNDADAIERCIEFIEAESYAYYHGRSRATMSRRLKHCQLNNTQSDRLVRAILIRFLSGQFSEQFKDQLQLVLHLDSVKAFETARKVLNSQREHVRRYAQWILKREAK